MAIQLEVALNLKGRQLLQFIKHHGALPTLRKRWDNQDQDQRFLRHFFLELENEEHSIETMDGLKKQLVFLQKTVKSDWEFQTDDEFNCGPVNINKFDLNLRSLGYSESIFPQELAEESLQEHFFALKFGGQAPIDRLAIPNMENWDDQTRNMIENHSDYPENEAFIIPKLAGPRQNAQPPPLDFDNIVQQYFFRLCCILLCLQKSSIHEAISLIVELLCRKDFSDVPYLKQFLLHAWGNLGVVLSMMNYDGDIVYSCLANVKKLAIFESDYLDYIKYRQECAYHLEDVKDESDMFFVLFKSISHSSMFKYQALQCHVQMVLIHVENHVMEMCILKRVNEMREFDIKKVQAQSLISSLRCVLHKVCSQMESKYNSCDGEKHNFAIVDLYELLVQIVSGDYHASTPSHINKIVSYVGGVLDNSNSHLDYFCSYFNDVNPVSNYLTTMDDFKKQVDNDSNLIDNIVYARVYVTHALLLKFLDGDSHNSAHYCQEAMLLYQKISHSRSNLLMDYIYVKFPQDRSYKRPQINITIKKDLTMKDILKDRQLRYIVRCGIKSLIQTDSVDLKHP